jgi:hypothetical protein
MNVKKTCTISAAVMGMLTLLVFSTVATANTGRMTSNISNDSIYIQKSFSSSKYRVKLYPDANHQVLFFSARGREGKAYQLFVFDVNGILVKSVNIRNKETTMLNKMEKGMYVFEVFSNDERIGNGQLFVR